MADKQPKNDARELFLIDGNSLAYRAFFALPEEMSTSDGRPTNAIYGFASMLAKLLIDHQPAAGIVVWDAGMSGREQEYEPYKAQRRSRPDLLREQWPHLEPMAEAFGFLNTRVEGYEADDVIAALVEKARDAGIRVMVVSGDRDVYQVVTDGVRVMTTSRGITDTRVYDREGVVERYGVPPELVPDLIGLKGDTSDNIPGVPGVGDKTAAQLLQRFGSLEEVLDHVDEISGAKRKQMLTEHAEDARISKRLATLQYEIDTELDLDAVMGVAPDLTRLREVAREFELRQVIQRLDEELPEAVPQAPPEERIEVDVSEGTLADLDAGAIATSVQGERWAATDGGRIVAGEVSDLTRLAAELRERPLIAHDFKSAGGGGRSSLMAAAEPDGLDLEHDTMVAAYLVDPARRVYELADLAAAEGLAAARPDGEQLALESPEGEAPADPAAEARLAWELSRRQRERLRELGLEPLLTDVEMPLIEVLAAMERIGVRVDAKVIEEIAAGIAGRA
ncbi:MAG TPA: 5'-3' exonuclease H3TH domain-containing protein, partial [Solirubrobacterales bacterium]|nr:5'-3' exonuclease H3TH domain-containing protein [Solirubrobacterales bacterium]